MRQHGLGERTSGLRSVLSSPRLYEIFQMAVGAGGYRERLVREHICPAPGMRVLDIGCGPGSMLDWLPDVRYVGFDPSPAYIAAASARFGGRGSFLVGGIDDLSNADLGRFDLVMAQGVLHHVDDETGSRLFALAARVLDPGGRVITIDPCLSPAQSRSARALITRDRGRHVRTAQDYRILAAAVFGDVAVEERSDLLRIPYTHAIVSASAA